MIEGMKRWTVVTIIAVSAWLAWPQWLIAANDPAAVSTHFGINEDTIGAIGDFNATSTHFSQLGTDDGGSTLGDNAVGNGSSTHFQINSGANTSASPVLGLTVNTGTVALGVLSTSAANTAIATFNVIDYSSYGFVVALYGNTPTSSGHQLTAITANPAGSASSAGTEQFGINTVVNSSPVVTGSSNPVWVPSGAFSSGVSGDGVTGVFGTTRPYTVPDTYRYISGETIASGAQSSGETDYTISFLANISALTPGGFYSSNMSIVATGTY